MIKCPECGSKELIIRMDQFDAEVCKKCKVWASEKCSDSTCCFCARRPEDAKMLPQEYWDDKWNSVPYQNLEHQKGMRNRPFRAIYDMQKYFGPTITALLSIIMFCLAIFFATLNTKETILKWEMSLFCLLMCGMLISIIGFIDWEDTWKPLLEKLKKYLRHHES